MSVKLMISGTTSLCMEADLDFCLLPSILLVEDEGLVCMCSSCDQNHSPGP